MADRVRAFRISPELVLRGASSLGLLNLTSRLRQRFDPVNRVLLPTRRHRHETLAEDCERGWESDVTAYPCAGRAAANYPGNDQDGRV